MQVLLHQGKIRPTKESVYNYYARAPVTIKNSRWHVLQATLDLYWAVMDAAHAALMSIGEVPPTPEHASGLLREKLAKPGHLEKKYPDTMDSFYRLMKMITHREIQEISGEEYSKYLAQAEDFVGRMKRIVDRR